MHQCVELHGDRVVVLLSYLLTARIHEIYIGGTRLIVGLLRIEETISDVK